VIPALLSPIPSSSMPSPSGPHAKTRRVGLDVGTSRRAPCRSLRRRRAGSQFCEGWRLER
jgi:hypothetical protein